MKFFIALVLAASVASTAVAQDAPVMIRVSTGSDLATWTVPATAKPAKKTPVIFLHGGPGLYTEARRIEEGAPLRAAGFATIYFDQAGGGKSGQLKASDYGLERAVADLEALRIALGQEKLILWGNSYGASLAAIYADRFPDRVAAILFTSPGMFPGYDGKRDYSQTNRDKVVYSKDVTKAVGLIDSKGGAAEATLSQADAGKLFDELAQSELIDGLICKGSQIKPPPLPGGGNFYAQRLISKDLKSLKFAPKPQPSRPTLIIRGSCDFLPAESAERYRALFGGRVEWLDKVGHGLLENPQKYQEIVAAFALQDLKTIP